MSNEQINEHARFNLKLGVIGHAPHWIGPDGVPWAYEPYVREMRVWADLFASIRICSPTGEGEMTGNLAPYVRENINWHPVSYSLAYGYYGALKRLLQLPGVAVHARRTILDSDFIMLRSPGHFGLVGAVLARSMRRSSITKWAGENGAFKGERLPSRIERRLQSIPNARHTVLVYGPPKSANQVSFLPALMLTEELARARALAENRDWNQPWRLLSVGRLEPAKGFDLAIKGLAELKRTCPSLPWTYQLIGDGSIRRELETTVRECGLNDRVNFTGALPFAEVQRHYATSHVVIMPGCKEGWPKVIAEGWAHGAIPVAASAGLVPWIVEDEDAGLVFEPTPGALATALSRLLTTPERMRAMSQDLFRHARELSLDCFKTRLESVLVERCGLV